MNIMDIAVEIVTRPVGGGGLGATEIKKDCVCHLNDEGRGHFTGCWNYEESDES